MNVVINSNCHFNSDNQISLVSEGNAVLNLLVSLGCDPLNPPLAALLSEYYHLKGEWLILSPAHWEASHNNAIIVAAGHDLGLSDVESRGLFNAFSEYLAMDGTRLYYHDANTWLMSANDRPVVTAKPVHHILNQPLMQELIHLDSTMCWQKFFTESQMFFATQSNNKLLNGIWVWGGGSLGDKSNSSICADAHFIDTAQICSRHVALYNPSLRLKEFDIILLNNMDVLSGAHQDQLKKMPANWYWNDSAYVCHFNWFTRLWRNITYAY